MATKTKKTKAKASAPAVSVTLATFDDRFEQPKFRVRRKARKLAGFPAVTDEDYAPYGSTPLYDAVAQFIATLDEVRRDDEVTIGLLLDESGSMSGNRQSVIVGANEFVDGMREVDAVDPDAAGTVLAVIMTDGLENASREVGRDEVRDMVRTKEGEGWTFIYLGSNQDAWAAGQSAGFSGGVRGQTVSYESTPVGTAAAMASVASDSADYLSDNKKYMMRRAGSSQRSVTESGEEVASNIGSSSVEQPKVEAYGDVAEALKRAKGE